MVDMLDDIKQQTATTTKKHTKNTQPQQRNAFLCDTIPRYFPFLKYYIDDENNNNNITKKIRTTKQSLLDVRNFDKNCRIVALQMIVIWLSLVTIVLLVTPSKHITHQPPFIANMHFICGVILLINIVTKLNPVLLENTGIRGPIGSLFFIDREQQQQHHSSQTQATTMSKKITRTPLFSGVVIATLTVQFIAATTDLVIFIFPTPTMTDAITGCDSNLFRWCAWIPLGYGMAYLTDGLDAPNGTRRASYFGMTNGFSCFFGLLLPFCSGSAALWGLMLTVSCLLFSFIYLRLYYKILTFRGIQRGESVEDRERYDRYRIGLSLMKVCAVTWSVLVVTYFVAWYLKTRSVNVEENNSWNMVLEPVVDVLAKHFYLNLVVEAHERVFDDKRRAERRLEELRRFVSIIWSTASDLLMISISGVHGSVRTQLSPSYAKILAVKEPNLSAEDYVMSFNLSDVANMKDVSSKKNNGVEHLLFRAWAGKERETVLNHKLTRDDGKIIQCEAKVTRLNDQSLIVVCRDITERYGRFEAEKKVISLITARKKDAEANQFTRHEVKNGILAAIGVCDSLRENITEKQKTVIGEDFSDTEKIMVDLDLSLNETLNSVVTETMARDIINGGYVPRLEPVDLVELFCKGASSYSTNRHVSYSFQRIPPQLVIDPQIIQYIHRNATNNAQKYGRLDAIVKTLFQYDEHKHMLELKVTNEPGPFHDKILKMGPRLAKELVFTPGKRLHNPKEHQRLKKQTLKLSSGDGAWIMRNCARALGGNCDYDFQEHQTVFTFICPANVPICRLLERKNNHANSNTYHSSKNIFPLPLNTLGIGIDDSAVQRKLLHKILAHTGMPEQNIIITGATNHQIQTFDDLVIKKIHEHPQHRLLVIVDENMDCQIDEVDEGSASAGHGGKLITVSGSMLVSQIIRRLSPLQERNLLALVRSANDSTADITKYEARAHGFLPKAPVSKSKVEAALAPLWVKRFGIGDEHSCSSHDACDSGSVSGGGGEEKSQSAASYSTSRSADLIKIDFEAELKASMERIDLLVQSRDSYSWTLVKELLHSFKGDLMTHSTNESCCEAMDIIDMLRASSYKDDFVIFQWRKVKDIVMDLSKRLRDKYQDVGISSSLSHYDEKQQYEEEKEMLTQEDKKQELYDSMRYTGQIIGVRSCANLSEISQDDLMTRNKEMDMEDDDDEQHNHVDSGFMIGR